MKRHIALISLIVAVSAPAAAAEYAGPRIEAHVGWDRVGLDAAYDDGFDAVRGSGSKDGVVYGVEAGYDLPLGASGIVVGVSAAVDLASTKECSEVYGDDRGCIKAGRDLEVGARLGTVVAQSALLYLRGAYVSGRVKVRYEDFEDILEDFSVGKNRRGLRVGGGFEIPFAASAYAKLEYRYTDYRKYSISTDDFDAVADLDRHQILYGMGIRF